MHYLALACDYDGTLAKDGKVSQQTIAALESAILNLLGSPFEERPTLFRTLLPTLQDLQVRFGHPHWLIVDEAHHLAPPEWEASPLERVRGLFNLLLITTHPDHVSKHVLALVDVVIVVGTDAGPTLSALCGESGHQPGHAIQV